MEADFSGYATKAGLKCSDGRTIMPDAFAHMDGVTVPLVWQHGHNEPSNILGHAVLEKRADGVYAYGYFNGTEPAQNAKILVQHGDITMLSIYANNLVEKAKNVLHGAIREVSLVLAGANPGALIDNVAVAHSDGAVEMLDDEAVIYTGLPLMHSDDEDEKEKETVVEEVQTNEEVTDGTPTKVVGQSKLPEGAVADSDENVQGDGEVQHAEGDETVKDIYNSLNAKQKDVVHYMIGVALGEQSDGNVEQSATGETDEAALTHKEGTNMTHNVFEQNASKGSRTVLSHEDVKGIMANAIRGGSLREAVQEYAVQHGIDDIDVLFPEARAIADRPEMLKRRTEWVGVVLDGARKSPFSRIKTLSADLTYDEARAKGYIKGNLKKEEFFGVAKRSTTPQTIYKKQKLDRDDVVDITDFDVVAWLKAEMRLMLDEELARAILIGDGRDVASEDKISETHIRPIATDDEFYSIRVPVNLDNAESSPREVVDALILSRRFYKGSGLPVFFTTESWLGQMMVLKDADGHRLYRTLADIAAELRVSQIVPVEVLEDHEDVLGIMVNMSDYVIGADRGGEVNMFDDFDIDWNQYKYLIETRVSGALVKLKSALIVVKSTANEVLAPSPDWDPETSTVTIPLVTGVVYQDASDNSVLVAGDTVLAAGEVLTVQAVSDTGYVLAPSARQRWTFRNRSAA